MNHFYNFSVANSIIFILILISNGNRYVNLNEILCQRLIGEDIFLHKIKMVENFGQELAQQVGKLCAFFHAITLCELLILGPTIM